MRKLRQKVMSPSHTHLGRYQVYLRCKIKPKNILKIEYFDRRS